MRTFASIVFVLMCFLSTNANGLDAQTGEYLPMAAIGEDGQLWLYGFDDEPQQITTDANCSVAAYHCDLIWSPDGALLAFALPISSDVGERQRRLMLLDTTDMSVVSLQGRPLLDFPISFSADGEALLFAEDGGFNDDQSPEFEFFFGANIYKTAFVSNETPQEIGYIQYDNAVGGTFFYSVDEAYWYDSGRDIGLRFGNPGFDRLLLETPFGILHTSGIWGSGVVQRYDSQTGDDLDLPYRPSKVVVSLDRTQLAGVTYDDGQIVVMNLATQATSLIIPDRYPELLAWGSDDRLFYSSRTIRENLFEQLTTEEREAFRVWTDTETIPVYDIQIWRVDIDNGESSLLYTSDAYAIGRLMPSPDGNSVFFSQINNIDDSLLDAMIDGLMDSDPVWDLPESRLPSLYRLNLADNSVELVASNVYKATINFPAYERMTQQSNG